LKNVPGVHVDAQVGFYPPLGLLSIAASMEKYPDHEVRVIDCVVDSISHLQLKEMISSEKPGMVGIYAGTFYLYDLILVTEDVKRINPDIIVVIGGPHVYTYPHQAISISSVDYAVYGEGEFVFPKLVERLDKHLSVDDLPGVLDKRNQKLELQRIPNLNVLPFPARHLVSYRKYRSVLAQKNPITTVMSSRGCPYNCYFCNNIERSKKVRSKDPKNVVDELQQCYEMGIEDFLFFDELFTYDKNRVLGICKQIISRNLPIRWHIRSRADTVDQEMVEWLARAGCRLIQFGIESGTPRMQKVINKRLNLNKVEQTVRMVKQHRISVYADFILGLPGETKEEMNQTIEFAVKLELDYAMFNIYVPLPETVFYRQGLVNGKIPKDHWLEYLDKPQTEIGQLYWPDFTWEELDKIHRKAFRKFYLRPRFVWKNATGVRSFRQLFWQIESAFNLLGRGY